MPSSFATTTATVVFQSAMGDPAACAKVPLPLLSITETVFDMVVGTHEVEIAVAVEVPQRDASWHSPDRDGRGGREGTIAVVAQHRDAVAAIVAGYEIDVAVAVEVTGFDFARAIPDRDGRAGRENAAAVAEQNGDVVADIVGEEKVEVAVTVEVGRGIRDGVGARWERANQCH